jgi:hypothetical protein
MWLRGDVDESKEYQVALCQSASGRRSYALHPASAKTLPPDTVFLTQAVPTRLLLQRNFGGISKAVLLTNGKSFGVEAHGVWFTQEECAALDRGEDWETMPWLNGVAPNLPQK